MCQMDYFTCVQLNEQGNSGPKCTKLTKIAVIFWGKVTGNETTILPK